MHAADVTQTIMTIYESSDMKNLLEMNVADIASFFIAAIVHDFKHTGQTNTYHINSHSDIALMYNDISVLENYHISETYKLLRRPSCNIFSKFSKEENQIIRKRIVDLIISTDMSLHTKLYSSLKVKVEKLLLNTCGKGKIDLINETDSPKVKFDTKQEVLNFTLHAADLSHNVKDFQLTQKWTYLLMNEFWKQGDCEKEEGLPVSFNCDRVTANIPDGQKGFLTNIIIPTFQLLTQIFPNINHFVVNARENYSQWENKII